MNFIQMMKPTPTIKYVLTVCLALLTLYMVAPIPKVKANNINAQVFKSKNGWGYNIMVNNQVLIHQETIPGVNNQAFKTKEQATAYANTITAKLIQQQTTISF